jgi:HSP20 family protein
MEVSEMVSRFPFGSDFVLLQDAMSNLLNESFVPSGGVREGWRNGTSSGARRVARPLPLDVYATPDEAVVIAAVPGMNPQDLEITYHQNTITLSGTVPSATESEQGQQAMWFLHELWHGQFQRSITLPFEVDAEKAEATFEHGIVRLVLPKAETARPRKIAVQAASGEQAIAAGATQS